MGLFSKIGSAVKRVATKAGGMIKAGAKKVLPVVMNIAEKGTNLLSHLPGTIGTVAGMANKGLNAVRNVISSVPNEKARNALTNAVNRGQNLVNSGQTAATNISNRAQAATPMLNQVSKVAQNTMRLVN